jgi:putative membrane protein
MIFIATVLVLLVAALHVYFMLLEMVLWTKPAGRKAFGLTEEFAESTKSLAANQGLYNGFLVAGLVWAAVSVSTGSVMALPLACFFLACVIVAGVFGAVTVSRKILFVQAAPALFAMAFVWLAHAR